MTLYTSTIREQEVAATWFDQAFGALHTSTAVAQFPVSFRYDDQEAAQLLKNWHVEQASHKADATGSHHTITLTDPKTGLQCRCEITVFEDFPAVEWVTYLKNIGDAATPLISAIRPLDIVLEVDKEQMCWLHHAKGSKCHLDDFEPRATQLTPHSDEAYLEAAKGRSSDGALPFFNLELGDHGVIGAIGWTGSWNARIQRRTDGAVHVDAGMRETHLRLQPGEEIRTPRILLVFWEQNRMHGHNMLRQFILAHHTPRPNGTLLQPPISDNHWGDRTEQHQIAKAHWLKGTGLPVEYFWIDADWYGDAPHNEQSDTFGREWAIQVGNWFPRAGAYPNGLKPIGDTLRELGMGFLLWVEPERVAKGTQIAREHPEWLFSPIGENFLFNLGIPEARQFITNLITNLITESGITCYRQDFNINPAPFWQATDAPDRIGMSEIRHIEGLYAFWDELLERHPGLIIDNCASGGRRIDLETISRSVPLWRSDVQCWPNFATTAMQNQTYGLGLWVPLSAGCAGGIGDTYAFRSALAPGIVFGWGEPGLAQGDAFPLDWCKKMLDELYAVRPYFYGDFYPLVSYSLADDAWAVWQYDRPDLGEGMVLALRRPQSPFPQIDAVPHGLDPEAHYDFRSVDGDFTLQASGKDLLERGLTIAIDDRPGSTLLLYKRTN